MTVCPRCAKRPLRFLTKDGTEIPGALSRADNKTEVCSACGNDEAMVNFIENRECQPVDRWPVSTPYGDSMEERMREYRESATFKDDAWRRHIDRIR